MNKSNEFEQIIKEKLDSFEYPLNNNAWVKFKNEIPGKSPFLGSAVLFSIVTILIIGAIWYFNNNTLQNVVCENHINTIVNNALLKISNDNKTINNNINPTDENKVNIKNENLIKTDNVVVDNNIQQNNLSVNNFDNKVNNNNIKQSNPVATFACNIYEGCQPLSVKFTPTEISDTIIYSWDFGDGTISTEKSPTHIYSKQGNYSVLLMVKYYKSEPVISNLKQNVIKVNELPVSNFVYQINGSNVDFANQSSNSQKYKWLFADSTSTDENCARNFYVNGKYLVKLVATNKEGCSDTSSKTIEIKIKHPIYVATAFTPNKDGVNSKIGPIVLNSQDYYYEFEIFNKTGICVYQAKGNNVAWDGINKFTHQPADVDMYFYKLKAVDKFGNVDVINSKFNLLK